MMRAFLLVFLFVLSVFSTNPGLQTTLTQNGLNFAKTVALEILNQKVQNLDLPPQQGVADVTLLGSISWSTSNTVLHSVVFPVSGIQILPGQGFYVYISGIAGGISLNWHYERVDWPHLSGSGLATIDVSSTSIELRLGVTAVNAKPYLTVQSISIDIGQISIHDSGGADWLYNLFISILKGLIVNDIQNALANVIKTQIDTNLNQLLANLPVNQNIINIAEIELGLSAPPIFGSGYITFPELGEFVLLPNKIPPFAPAIFNPIVSSSYMLEVSISSFVLDAASWAFFTAGFMQGRITPAQVPDTSPIQLNTSSWSTIVPALFNLYPNYLMEVELKADSAPIATFSSQGITVSGKGEIDIYVILPNKTVVPAFTLGVTLSASGTAFINGLKISGNLTYLSDSFYLKASYIGPFDSSNIDTLLKFALSGIVIPYLNNYLAPGFIIPLIEGVELLDPVISYYNGFVELSTNLKYVA